MRGATHEAVGWVERSDTHRLLASQLMGFAALYPSYEPYGFGIVSFN
jgi:hypothetical protein